MIYDVFISYSTNDQKVVEELSAYLERNGIRCFVSSQSIPKGIDWAEAITTAIENCRLMIVVFSEHFNRSKHVDREIALCIQEEKPIVTFKIQNATFTGTKKYYLQNLNWIEAFPHPEKYFENLCSNVRTLAPEICLSTPHQKVKKKYPIKFIYYTLAGIIIMALLYSWMFYGNKTERVLDDISTPIIDTIQMDTIQPDTIEIDAIQPDIIEVEQSSPPVNVPNTSTTNSNKDKNNATETVTYRYDHTDILTSLSGEQFQVEAGDRFEGEVKAGKVITGKVIRDDKTVKIFLEKRNN